MTNKSMKKLISLALVSAMATSLTAVGVSAEATEGKVLNIGVNMAPQNISPFTMFNNRQPVDQYIYEKLMIKDLDGEWQPQIAKSMTTEDNLTYTFEIFDYVKDSEGNEITAEDCVFSLIHSRDEASNTWITDAAVTGDYTFTLTVPDTQPSTLTTAVSRAPIVDQGAYEADENGMSVAPVSTAPFKVTEFVSNVSIKFGLNENYWQTDEQYMSPIAKNKTVDGMNFTKIAEAAQQTIALETGTVDAFYGIATTEVPNFIEGGRNAEKFTALGYASDVAYCFYFANQSIFANDLKLRQAAMYAMDKEVINVGVMGGLGIVPTFYGAPDNISDLTPTELTEEYFAYDLEKAKALVEESNYNGEEVRLLVPNEDNHNRIAAIVQGQLMAIGINVKIEAYDGAMFNTAFVDGSAYDIAICQMGLRDIAFVWKFLSYELSGGEAGAMGMALQDEKLDEMLARANSIEGHTNEVATEVNNYIFEQAYSEPLVVGSTYIIFNKDLGAVDVPYFTGDYCGDRTIACTTFE